MAMNPYSAPESFTACARDSAHQAVLLFKPKHRIGHPENYVFSLSEKIFSGSKYPKKEFYFILKTEALTSGSDFVSKSNVF